MRLRSTSHASLSFRIRVCHPNTRIYVRLLGPCFKTGRLKPFRQTAMHCSLHVPEQSRHLSTRLSRIASSFKQLHSPKQCQIYLSPVYNSTHSQAIRPPSQQPSRTRKLPLTRCSECTLPWLPHPSQPILASIVSLLTISRTFNSLFKVLFIFPSRYLFAIGLLPIFSLRWSLPPTLSCIPKQLDSLKTPHTHSCRMPRRDYHPLWCSYSKGLEHEPAIRQRLFKLQFGAMRPDFKFELFPLHSPLLRESLLVSFPPLTDMLKFSG